MPMAIPLGLIAALAAPAAASAQRPPDAHVLRPQPGDVIDVIGEPAKPSSESSRKGYEPPYPGWRYAPVAVGQRLSPAFLAPRYLIAEPARQGLPAARGNRRWIRYGEDALLVDLRTQRVVQAVRNRCR